MIGLFILAILVVMGILVVASVGFVFVVLGTAFFKAFSNCGPLIGRLARAGGVAVAAITMAVVSVNIVAGHQDAGPHATVHLPLPETAQVSLGKRVSAASESHGVEPARRSPLEVVSLAERYDTATPADPALPIWVTQGAVTQDGVTYVVIESDRKASREDANASITVKAAKLIEADFAKHHSADVSWNAPQQVVEDAIRRTYLSTEENVALTDTFEHDMYRAYAQVAISPSLRDAIYPGWRKLVVTQRLVKLGQGFGLISLLVLSLATYLRYDKRTLGKKKGRLGVLSLAILATGTVAVGAIGDSIRSKLSASNIIAEEYDRDRAASLDETVIGMFNQQPLIQVEGAPNTIAVLIENAGHLQRPDVISREMSDAIGMLSKNTTVEVHVVSNGTQSEAMFVGGQDATAQINALIHRHKGMETQLQSEVQAVVSSGAQSVYVVTEGLTNLSDSVRKAVLQIRSQAPVHFIKLSDSDTGSLDQALQSFSAKTGGQLRFLKPTK